MAKLKGSFGNRSVKITGGRAEIKDIEKVLEIVDELDGEHGTTSQLFDAKRIAGKEHILHASKLALESLEGGNPFANSPKIELTCWVAGLRQIDKALEGFGIKEGAGNIAVVTIGEREDEVETVQRKILKGLNIEEDREVLELTEDKIEGLQEQFSITQNQLEVSSIQGLVLEKIALLNLEK